MKKILILLVAVLAFSGTAFSHNGERCQKSNACAKSAGCESACPDKASYFASAFGLNDSDAAKFKTMYDSYIKEFVAIKKKANEGRKAGMTEAEIETFIKNNINADREQADLQDRYYGQFRTMLEPTQILGVFTGRLVQTKCDKCPNAGTAKCDKASAKCNKSKESCDKASKCDKVSKCDKGDKCCKVTGKKCDKKGKTSDCCKKNS